MLTLRTIKSEYGHMMAFHRKGKGQDLFLISANLRKVIEKLLKNKALDDYVFRPFKCQDRLYKRFSSLLKRLGMKGTLHDLQHTFASHLVMSGVPIPVIKELLGHSDISTTMIYAHLSPNIHQAAIDKLNL